MHCGDRRRVRCWGLAAVLVLLAQPAGTFAEEKVPVPDDARQKQAEALVWELYGQAREAATTADEKIKLANKLVDQAAQSKPGTADHYVLLRAARQLAVEAADARVALDAVDAVAETYAIDPIKTKLECLRGVGKAAKLSSQRAALAEEAFSLVDDAVDQDNFEAAGQFAKLAREAAEKARQFALVKETSARIQELDELQAAHAEYQKATARLEQDPIDPVANLTAGRYLCLVKDDWDRGVAMLALGSDPGLKEVAVKELEGAPTPEAQAELGDQWWDLAETRQGEEQDALLLRAGHWYEQAEPKMASTLARAKVQDRLEQIDRTGRSKRRTQPTRAGTSKPFDPTTALLLATLSGHTGPVRSIAFGPDGSVLFSASTDHSVRFWDVAKRQVRGSLPPFKNRDLLAALSPDGWLLAVANGDPTVSLWDVKRGRFRGVLAGHTAKVESVAFSPDGSLLATGGDDKALVLWQVVKGQIRRRLGPLGGKPWSVAFSPDGSLLACGSLDRLVTVWDVATGELRHTLAGHARDVRCVAFSPDGSTLASSSKDGTVRLWDPTTGALKQTLPAGRCDLWALAFSPDGSTLASAGNDAILRFWSVPTGVLRNTLSGHTGNVWALAFSPDGSLLASASGDGTIKLWGSGPFREGRGDSPSSN